MTTNTDATEIDPHIPTPREDELPNGDLVVSTKRFRDREAVVVPINRRPLYHLLMEILAEAHVPDTMPARIALACETLVEARETVMSYQRGSVELPGAGYGMSYCHAVRDAINEYRDREDRSTTLVTVGCSGSKYDVDGAVPAKDLYKGAYWSCKQSYGETIGDEWRIISAKHAVLDPDEEIPTYERIPKHLKGIPVDSDQRLPNGDPVRTLLDQWALNVYHGLTRWLYEAAGGIDPMDAEIQILIGRSYRDPLEERGVFDRLSAPAELEISFPFQEVEQAKGGNGNQMGWMTDVVDEVSC